MPAVRRQESRTAEGSPERLFISSSLVKEIAAGGSDVSRYLQAPVLGPALEALGKRCSSAGVAPL